MMQSFGQLELSAETSNEWLMRVNRFLPDGEKTFFSGKKQDWQR